MHVWVIGCVFTEEVDDVDLVCSLFARLEQRIEHEKEQKERSALRRLNRKLKEVHEELTQHNATLDRCCTGLGHIGPL